MNFAIEIIVNDSQARTAFDAIFEALDRVAGWPVDATEIDRWADDGGAPCE